MKLVEVIVDLELVQDQMQGRDNEDANEHPVDQMGVDAERKAVSPRRNSNVGKAKRIVNKAKMHKRQSNPTSDETSHQSHIGGHGSAFLFR